MTHIPRAEFDRIRRLSAERKAKRVAKGVLLGLRTPGGSPRRVKSLKSRIPARRRAFDRLKAACKAFILLRAKIRAGSCCEVGVLCGGIEPAVLAYHIFPAATGNALKYDSRNLLGACARCNGAEYFDRKRGTYERWDEVHKKILGGSVWSELKSEQGRRQISTVEANEMADVYEKRYQNILIS